MEELDSSELGTKEYWDSCYEGEIKNFGSRGDPGEIWFGEDIVDRIIRWMNRSESVKKDAKVLDVGCGNGMLLIELAREGFTNLSGVDYSENAIKLAESVAEQQNVQISYQVGDILVGLSGDYDIILDKGTYDAISLSNEAKNNRQKYIENVYKSLKSDGILIITTCNWTLSELNEHFNVKFDTFDVIPTPQFKFGGTVGSVVTSCIFKKKN